MKTYFKFLLLSYVTAIFFETLANTIGDGVLFQGENWFIFFLVWYGCVYTVLYFLFKSRSVWLGVVFFAIFGTVAEILVFKRSHLVIDPIIYALMAIVPLWANKKYLRSRS